MEDITNYDIVICSNYVRNNILNNNPFINTKFMNDKEFISEYVYKYKASTLFYLVNHYNLLPSNAKEIMNNLYYIDAHFNDKTKYLFDIKNDLIDNNFIIFNDNFKSFIRNKKILVNYPKTKYFSKTLKGLNYHFNEQNEIQKKYSIYEFENMEKEVIFTASKIVDLINSGIDINNIRIHCDSTYTTTINKIFNLFNIPFNLNKKVPLYYLDDVKKFYKNIDFNIKLSDLKEYLDSLDLSIETYNKIISIVNKYTDLNPIIKDFYSTLMYELKHSYLINQKYEDCVLFVDLFNSDLTNSYVFLLGFNQSTIPIIHKDEEYLSDNELERLLLDTSYDNNTYEKIKVINRLNEIDNLYISYKREDPFNKYVISSIVDNLDYEIIKEKYNYNNLNINKLLFASKLDELLKYNIKSNDLNDLYTNTDIPYNDYSNSYTKVNLKNNQLNLSTTNMEQFFKCQYSFYLNNILKLGSYEETTSIKIGNLFHKVLETIYRNNTNDYEDVIDKCTSEYFKENTLKQTFYNKKYKKILLKLIDTINDNLEQSNFKNSYFEEWFSIDKEKDLKVVGKIDKIMTFNDGINNYIVLIDYKTGGLHYDFNKVIYGLDMQLLVYLYLIKKSNKINNPIFTGMYLMPILTDTLKSEKNKTYDELLKENNRLCGYSNSNLNNLSNFDTNLDNSFIKGIKLKKDNSFYAYSKVLNDIEIDELIKIIDNNINEVIKCIKNADFKINPKRLGKNNISCTYCKYKDICYMTNNDIVNLKEYKKLEFLNQDDI